MVIPRRPRKNLPRKFQVKFHFILSMISFALLKKTYLIKVFELLFVCPWREREFYEIAVKFAEKKQTKVFYIE